MADKLAAIFGRMTELTAQIQMTTFGCVLPPGRNYCSMFRCELWFSWCGRGLLWLNGELTVQVNGVVRDLLTKGFIAVINIGKMVVGPVGERSTASVPKDTELWSGYMDRRN